MLFIILGAAAALVAAVAVVFFVIKPGSPSSPAATSVAVASPRPTAAATGAPQPTRAPSAGATDEPADEPTEAPPDEPTAEPTTAPETDTPITGSSDAEGPVKGYLAAVTSGNWDDALKFVCTDSQAAIRQAFDPSQALGAAGQAFGVTAEEFLAAFEVELGDVKVGTPEIDGESATVTITGTTKVSIVPEKFRAILKKYMQAQGSPVDDATLDIAITAMGSSFEQSSPIDTTLSLKRENGVWLICE